MSFDPVLIARCTDILRQEHNLLARLAATQEVVRLAVYNREWAGLEDVLARLAEYSKEFLAMEAERERIFDEMNPRREFVSFYAVLGQLDAQTRRELGSLYRKLRLDSLKVRLANEALNHYIASARVTVSGFLDAAFPDRRGRLYTRHGAARSSDLRSLVLNQRL